MNWGFLIIVSIASVNCLTFNRTFYMETFISLDKDIYACQPTLIGCGKKLEAVEGDHMFGRTNDQVEYLLFYGQTMTTFPKGIERFFPNLLFLYIGEAALLYYGRRLAAISKLIAFLSATEKLPRAGRR